MSSRRQTICDYLKLSLLVSCFCLQSARALDCEQVLAGPPQLAEFLTKLPEAFPQSVAVHAAFTRNKYLKEVVRPEDVYALLNQEEDLLYIDSIAAIFTAVNEDPSPREIVAKLNEAWPKYVAANSLLSLEDAALRWQRYLAEPNLANLLLALGKLRSLADTQKLFYGNDPLRPSPGSALAAYLAESGAASRTLKFARTPGENPRSGVEKLVVALSQATFASYLKYFKNAPELFIHLHTPRQGTLQVVHQGKLGSYANLSAALRLPGLGTILPHILLSSSEAARMRLYLELGKTRGNAGTAVTPWLLGTPGHAYAATGGYTSCTHWVGNIPIGDDLVTEYRFPGFIDQHATNRVSNDPVIDALPRVKGLEAHGGNLINGQVLPAQAKKLATMVWKAPGHEQLADVLGQQEANLRGEFANPGWVAMTLTATTPNERVPVVFVVVPDARRPIPDNFDPLINPI